MTVAKSCDTPWLVERDPMLHTVSEAFVTDIRIGGKILNDARLVEPSSISLLEFLR